MYIFNRFRIIGLFYLMICGRVDLLYMGLKVDMYI